MFHSRVLHQRPLVALNIVGHIPLVLCRIERHIQLVAVVGPRSELHVALLRVEGEVQDVDGAGAFKDGGRDPHDAAVATDDRKGLAVLF